MEIVPAELHDKDSFKEIMKLDKKKCYEVVLKNNMVSKIKVDESYLLFSTVNTNNLTELGILLNKGYNVNAKYNNTYLLHEAIRKNNLAMVNLLL